MKTSFLLALLLVLTACWPNQVEVAWGPSPWYTYCSWDAPCWYGDNVVFVYGWGYLDRPSYVLLYANPGRREGWEHRRRDWHPNPRPQYRGRDWDTFKQRRDQDHHDKDHKDRDRHENDRNDR